MATAIVEGVGHEGVLQEPDVLLTAGGLRRQFGDQFLAAAVAVDHVGRGQSFTGAVGVGEGVGSRSMSLDGGQVGQHGLVGRRSGVSLRFFAPGVLVVVLRRSASVLDHGLCVPAEGHGYADLARACPWATASAAGPA